MGCNAWNHPPNCSCGWGGDTGGGVSYEYLHFHNSRRRSAAREILNDLKSRSHAACYVNPNATCPVCGQRVFFYANAHGSRVYFDDLGPPWPKHGCTSNGTISHREGPTYRPTFRTKVQIGDIVDAARLLGDARIEHDWTLFVVTQVRRQGRQILIRLEAVSQIQNAVSEFSYIGDDIILCDGDLVSGRGTEFSFLRQDTLEPIVIKDGDDIDRSTASQDDLQSVDYGLFNVEDLPASDRRHFHSPMEDSRALAVRMRPILSDFTNRNIIGPSLVSHYLKAAGHETACGGKWTSHLVKVLLQGLGFPTTREPQQSRNQRAPKRAEQPKNRAKPKNSRKPQETHVPQMAAHKPHPPKRATEQKKQQPHEVDWDQAAQKLSKLGRVTRRND